MTIKRVLLIACILLSPLSIAPVMAAGCNGVSLHGEITSAETHWPVDLSFDQESAQITVEGVVVRKVVLNETCTSETISFSLDQLDNKAWGSCNLYLRGSDAVGDCEIEGKKDYGLSATVDVEVKR